jgi:small-conductance mechanosensitive channel
VSIWSLDRHSPRSRQAIGLDLAACVIAVVLLLVIAVDFSPPLRLVLALVFTFYVPGRAIVSNWPRMERWSAIGMSVVFSLGVLTLLAMITLWAGQWHPLALFLVEAVASLAGLVLAIARRLSLARRRPAVRRDLAARDGLPIG